MVSEPAVINVPPSFANPVPSREFCQGWSGGSGYLGVAPQSYTQNFNSFPNMWSQDFTGYNPNWPDELGVDQTTIPAAQTQSMDPGWAGLAPLDSWWCHVHAVNVAKLSPDIAAAGNLVTLRISAGFLTPENCQTYLVGNELQLDYPASADYVRIMDAGHNNLLTPAGTAPNDPTKITLLRDSNGNLQHRLFFDQGNPSLVQHYEMDVYIGDQVDLGLCDVEVNLGAIHSYPEIPDYDWPEPYNDEQADEGYHKMAGALNLIKIDMSDGVDYDALVKIHGTQLPDGSWFAVAPMLDANHPANMLVRFLKTDNNGNQVDDDNIVSHLRPPPDGVGDWTLKDGGVACQSLDKWKDSDECAFLAFLMGLSVDDVYDIYLDILGLTDAQAQKRWETKDFLEPEKRTLTLQAGATAIPITATMGMFEWVDKTGATATTAKDATDGGETYRLRLRPLPTPPDLVGTKVSINVFGAGAADFTMGYTMGADNLVQYGGHDATFSFVMPSDGPPAISKGVTPGTPTVICAGGNSVIAQLANPKGGAPLAIAQIETTVATVYPYETITDPSLLSGIRVTDEGKLRAEIIQGKRFRDEAGGFKFNEVIGGTSPNGDKDSAQVGISWDSGASHDTNANASHSGASWIFVPPGPAATRATKDFPIPSGATSVDSVAMFTDIVRNPNDAPLVLGAWHGTRQPDGRWTFVADTPLAPKLIGNYAIPPAPFEHDEPGNFDETGSEQCTTLARAVIPYLIGKVGYILKRRSMANNGGGTHPVTNTGYDMQLGSQTLTITSALWVTAQTTAPFTYQIRASADPTSYSATGLPAGLTIDTTTGVISGTRTTGGDVNVTIGTSNGVESDSATLLIEDHEPR